MVSRLIPGYHWNFAAGGYMSNVNPMMLCYTLRTMGHRAIADGSDFRQII